MPLLYSVRQYSITELELLLSVNSRAAPSAIKAKRHLAYFEEYFIALGAQTIVVEEQYTDRDYLEDFAGYYVRCFEDYARKCTRLHFFTGAFDVAAFNSLLEGGVTGLTVETLGEIYLGFLVVKPLPETIIGRTCLRTYPSDGHRHFPIVRHYEANLFGIPLKVDSLAYQEQDAVAAACATSALWAAFNGTGKQFQHPIPSPVEITKAATSHVPLDTRTFPNSVGLDIRQMADAIRIVGLEPALVSTQNEWVLRGTLYAYLRGQIPMLLIVALYDPKLAGASTPEPVALHAVTCAGYSLGGQDPTPYTGTSFKLRAFRLDKIYVHDDQVGPFARMEALTDSQFTTSWINSDGSGTLNASVEQMLIPLYHKIRIPYQSIYDIVSRIGIFLETLRANTNLPAASPIEFDIYLTTVNNFKSDLRDAATLASEHRLLLLTTQMPRFLWRATALVGDVPAMDLLFDATDIEQGPSFVCAVFYDSHFEGAMKSAAISRVNIAEARNLPERHVLRWLVDN